MYIKQITLQGFASYKERTTITLDHKHNVIVGANGAGKSNIFRAVEFVLSATTGNETEKIKHHSFVNQKETATFVEIVLDNSDAVLLVKGDGNDVYIKRSITDSKDQYSLNSKNVTKTEIIHLFESMGLSRKYPNYIIKEGQVNKIATGSDSYRLKLLEEAAGSRLVDEQLSSTTKDMQQTEMHVDVVDEFFRMFQNRAQNLEMYTASLRELQLLKSDRNGILHHINHFNKQQKENRIKALEQKRMQLEWSQEGFCTKIAKASYKAHVIKIECEALERDLNMKNSSKDACKENLQQLRTNSTDFKLRRDEIQRKLIAIQSTADEKERMIQESENLQTEINNIEAGLEDTRQQNLALAKNEVELKIKLEGMEYQRTFLLEKRNRKVQHSTKNERDTAIQVELAAIDKLIDELKVVQEELLSEQRTFENDIENMQMEINNMQTEKEELEKRLEEIDLSNKELASTAEILCGDICDLTAQLCTLHTEHDIYVKDLSALQDSLPSLIDRKIFVGAKSMKEIIDYYTDSPEAAIADSFRVEDYLERVVDNFRCDTRFYRAIEAAIGNRLYCHIFEQSSTVEIIARKLEEVGYSGRIPMIALDDIELPQRIDDENFTMLIDNVNYEPKFETVMQLIFGNIAIVNEISEGSFDELLGTGLSFVTRDGCYLSANGGLYIPNNSKDTRSKVDIFKRQGEYLKAVAETESSIKQIYSDLASAEEELVAIEKQFDLKKHGQLQAKNEILTQNICALKRDFRTIAANQLEVEDSIAVCRANLLTLELMKKSFEIELKEEISTDLSDEEQQMLTELNEQITEVQLERYEIIGQIADLDINLSNDRWEHFTGKLEKIKLDLENISYEERNRSDFEAMIEDLEHKQSTVQDMIDQMQREIQTNMEEVARLQLLVTQMQPEYEKWMQNKLDLEEKWQRHSWDLNLIAAQIEKLHEEPKVNEQSVEELNSTAYQHAIAKFDGLEINELNAQLKRIDTVIKNFPPVNFEAANQLGKITEAIKDFSSTADSLRRGNTQIENIITIVRDQKPIVIQRSFDKMSNHFATTFKKLVPTGRGSLILIKQNGDEDELSRDTESSDSQGVYTGISIKVSFNEDENDVDMMRLSGGQKHLVAVAFVLSLQVLAPAPFYLLDEIDHALDAQYRATLADVIHELSEHAQFIMSSFWPEQMKYANVFFGVKSARKVSNVKRITREEAEQFVKQH